MSGELLPLEILIVSRWTDTGRADQLLRNPSWGLTESVIRALNGSDLTDLYLRPRESDADTYLSIGGGPVAYIAAGSIEGKNQRFRCRLRQASSNCSISAVSSENIVRDSLSPYRPCCRSLGPSLTKVVSSAESHAASNKCTA